MTFKRRLKILSIVAGALLFIVFCFMFPPVGGTMIGLGAIGWYIVHTYRKGKQDDGNSDCRSENSNC